MARSKYHWYAPVWTDAGPHNPSTGTNNVGNEIVINLLNTDWNPPGDPVADNFVVERVVGQYLLHASMGASDVSRMVHHRVYVAPTDENTVSLREISTLDDADTSFLWHQVDGWGSGWADKTWGSWRQGVTGDPQTLATAWKGRQGHFDIGVGRFVGEGTSLLWHTELQSSVFGQLTDDTWALMMWCRVLMKEA